MEKKIKIVGVISSANFDGNTATLVRAALKEAESEGAQVAELFLARYRLGFCTGCLSCTAKGSCPIPDDLEELRKTLYEADGIILGSPTYGGEYNAGMKNLFERLGPYTLFSSAFGGKYVVGMSTANGKGAAATARELAAICSFGFFQRTFVSGTLGVRVLYNGTQLRVRDNRKALAQSSKLGKRLVDDIRNGNRYPLQNFFIRSMMRLKFKPMMTKYILRNKDGKEKATYESLLSRGLI